jgi:RHS repeat-associated protein
LYERDNESGLDFAQARYYNYKLGRFNSVDPVMASADIINPQTWNRYAYVGNNPVNITDPTGLIWGEKDGYLYWFKGDVLPSGYNTYSALVGRAVGGGLVVLNGNGTTTAVASAGEALRLIMAAGAAAAALEASAVALGVTAVAAAGLAAAYVCSLNPSSCGRSATYGAGMPGTMSLQDSVSMQRYLYGKDSVPSPLDYFDAQGNILPQYLMNENTSESSSNSSANTQGQPSTGNPNPDDPNKPTLRHAHRLKESTLEHIRKWSTDKIIDSLKPGSKSPLITKPDGTIMQGNHRVQVLRERGITVDKLPREIYTPSTYNHP